MSLKVAKAMLSVPDGLVQSGNEIWFHFQKFPWYLHDDSKNPGPGIHRRHIEARLQKGLLNSNPKKHLKGTFHLGISPHIFSYYHFLSDLLPHLVQSKIHPVLLPEGTPKTFIEFILSVGFPVQILCEGIYQVEQLLIPKTDHIDWDSEKVQSLQCFMNQQIPLPINLKFKNLNPVKRIYISREFAGHRHFTNEKELLPVLHKYGFQKIILEQMSIFEQVKLMREATHVVGAHGAGLANIMFAPTSVRILEIRPTLSSGQFCFDQLFANGWLHHEVLVPPKQRHFGLPPNILENILKRWEEKPSQNPQPMIHDHYAITSLKEKCA